MERLDGFNSDLNKNGEYVKIFLGSRVIGESITFFNVRQFHGVTPHWNDSTIDQAIGRVVRNGSHSALEPEKRQVDIYINAAVLPDDPYNSIDTIKLQTCQEKQTNIQHMEQLMIDNAVDKYCLRETDVIDITDVTTFAIAYIDNHLEHILHGVTDVFMSRQTININKLSRLVGIHPLICKEAICRIIL
ncbi:hypothetical protein SpCBS45565_g06238 [Spizellomyces sp. 'palustris']|nr:hypothetical protein SpCBS45565_g06238 [Spizellomyces sp. 'palustris']